jgi:hypothetical protein
VTALYLVHKAQFEQIFGAKILPFT